MFLYLLVPPSLKNYINMLLELLVDELLILGDGIRIYDSYKKQYRDLFVYLLRTVCDLPARRSVRSIHVSPHFLIILIYRSNLSKVATHTQAASTVSCMESMMAHELYILMNLPFCESLGTTQHKMCALLLWDTWECLSCIVWLLFSLTASQTTA
jgi:hypothetical protein